MFCIWHLFNFMIVHISLTASAPPDLACEVSKPWVMVCHLISTKPSPDLSSIGPLLWWNSPIAWTNDDQVHGHKQTVGNGLSPD